MNSEMIGPGKERDGITKSNPGVSLYPRERRRNERCGGNVGERRTIALRSTSTNEADERLNIYIIIRASMGRRKWR